MIRCRICNTELLYGGKNASLCGSCESAGKTIITLTNKFDIDNNSSASSNSTKGLANTLKWVEKMMAKEKEQNEKITYLSGFASAFREQLHTDIELKPGNNGPSIPAHKALLAARSCIFRNMMDSDKCKAPPNKTLTFRELNHEELECLLEFLYGGSLPKEKMEKHVQSLLMAADKYQIPFLQTFCEHHVLGLLNSTNALDILEMSDDCCNENLQEAVLNFIQKNVDDIIFSTQYDEFALKNPLLAVRITRAVARGTNKKARRTGVGVS